MFSAENARKSTQPYKSWKSMLALENAESAANQSTKANTASVEQTLQKVKASQ